MSYNEKPGAKYSRLLILIPIYLTFFLSCWAVAEEAGNSTIDQPLNDADLQALQSSLNELKTLAPKLRVQLRTLRSQVGFDPREIHLIERGMSQSQKNLERLIAMTKRNAFNPMRAHFMADDLRRKSEGLKASLAYVERHFQELSEDSGDSQTETDQKRSGQALVDLLGRYSELVSENVVLLQSKGI